MPGGDKQRDQRNSFAPLTANQQTEQIRQTADDPLADRLAGNLIDTLGASTGRYISMAVPGRGTAFNPANRYASTHTVPTDDEMKKNYTRVSSTDTDTDEDPGTDRFPQTHYHEERARSIISRNQSPDIPFDQSINPYRGCEHGCIYCYARPTHAY